MTFGPTDAGFKLKTLPDIQSSLLAKFRAQVSPSFSLDPVNPIGQTAAIFAGELSPVWEFLQEAHNVLDPDNTTGDRVKAIALGSGVSLRSAQPGLVTATLDVDAGFIANPGEIVAHVVNDPDNLWQNRDAIPIQVVSTDSLEVVFISQGASSAAVAPAGSLTEQVTSLADWFAITNDDDATPGTDIETTDALRLRREFSIAGAGSANIPAIEAAVLQVPGVLGAKVFENTTNAYTDTGISPVGMRLLVWDGDPAQADDVAIADAFLSVATSGVTKDGAISVTSSKGQLTRFSRVSPVAVAIEVGYSTKPGQVVSEVQIQEALLSVAPTQGGETIFRNTLLCAILAQVPQVEDVTFLSVAVPPNGPVSNVASFTFSPEVIATFDTSDITFQ